MTPFITAALTYRARQKRQQHPDGDADQYGTWRPSLDEARECCMKRGGRFKDDLMDHCRSARHILNLFGLSETVQNKLFLDLLVMLLSSLPLSEVESAESALAMAFHSTDNLNLAGAVEIVQAVNTYHCQQGACAPLTPILPGEQS